MNMKIPIVLLFGIATLSLTECFVTAEDKEAAEGKGYQGLQGDASQGRLAKAAKGGLLGYYDVPAERREESLRRLASLCMQLGGLKNSEEELLSKK